MTRDVNLISEAYLSLKKKINEQAPQAAPTAQASPAAAAPVQAGSVTVGNPQGQPPVQQPPAAPAAAVKASKEQEKAVKDLLKSFGLPESVAPYLIQALIEQIPGIKSQYGI